MAGGRRWTAERRQTVHLMDGFRLRTIKNIIMWTEVDGWTDGRNSVRRGLNRPWSLVVKILQTWLPPGKILDRGRKYSQRKDCAWFSWKKYQENVCIAYESRKHIMVHVKWLWVMTELQTRFRIWKRQYFEKRFLPAYSTALRAPETRKGKKKYFFKTLLDGPLRVNKE